MNGATAVDVTDATAVTIDRARLYLYGPRDDVSLAIMGTDANGDPVEQIDLTDTTAAGVTVDASGFHYTMTVPSGLEPGTYIVLGYVRYYAGTSTTRETSYTPVGTLQIGTTTPSPVIAGSGCGSCHDNGSVAHNNFDLENGVDVCLACHNGTHTFPISNRVHAIQPPTPMATCTSLILTTGGYKSPLNSGRDWSDIEYPQDVTHCQTCHTSGDTSYLEKASTAPCFGCHGGLTMA